MTEINNEQLAQELLKATGTETDQVQEEVEHVEQETQEVEVNVAETTSKKKA